MSSSKEQENGMPDQTDHRNGTGSDDVLKALTSWSQC